MAGMTAGRPYGRSLVGGGDGGNQIDEICHASLHPMVLLLLHPSEIAEGDLSADSGFCLDDDESFKYDTI